MNCPPSLSASTSSGNVSNSILALCGIRVCHVPCRGHSSGDRCGGMPLFVWCFHTIFVAIVGSLFVSRRRIPVSSEQRVSLFLMTTPCTRSGSLITCCRVSKDVTCCRPGTEGIAAADGSIGFLPGSSGDRTLHSASRRGIRSGSSCRDLRLVFPTTSTKVRIQCHRSLGEGCTEASLFPLSGKCALFRRVPFSTLHAPPRQRRLRGLEACRDAPHGHGARLK